MESEWLPRTRQPDRSGPDFEIREKWIGRIRCGLRREAFELQPTMSDGLKDGGKSVLELTGTVAATFDFEPNFVSRLPSQDQTDKVIRGANGIQDG